MSSKLESGVGVARIVERQMRNWELAQAQHGDTLRSRPRPDLYDFVCVERDIASGGTHVARLLGERLGWPVFDRDLLQAMAADERVREMLYRDLDEQDMNWLESMLRSLVVTSFHSEGDFHRLAETVLALARRGSAVFLGRGIETILPRGRGLRVKVTASLAHRVQVYAAMRQLPEPAARMEIMHLDQEREGYRRGRFGEPTADATQFDLTISTDRCTPAQAVEIVVTTLRSRGIEA